MLETIREYGLECLTASGELEETCRAHALYYVRLAEEVESKLRGPQQTEWLGRLERENDNLRTALLWALEHEERRLALRMASALLDFWLLQGHVGEGYAGLSRALVKSEGVEAPVLAKAFSAFGWLAWAQGDFSQAEEWCQKSLSLYREEGEMPGIALSLYRLGWVGILRGDHAQARLLLEESLALFRELDDSLGIGDALGNISLIQGEYARASALLEQSLMLYRQVGYPLGVAEALNLLARALLFKGELTRAQALLEEGLALFRQIGYKQGVAFALLTKGFVVLGLGADRTARATARSLLEEGLALARVGRWRQSIVWGVHGLGLVAFFEQDYGTARSLFEEGLTLCRQLGNRTFAAFYLEGLTMIVAAQGQPAWAAQLWGAAHRLRQTINAAVPAFVQPIHEHLVMNLQAQLSEGAFRALWEQGQMMTLDQVLTVGELAEAFSPGREES